jgi:hypothetical protein
MGNSSLSKLQIIVGYFLCLILDKMHISSLIAFNSFFPIKPVAPVTNAFKITNLI